MNISKTFFSFSGRISRSTYWVASLGIGVVYLLAMGLMTVARDSKEPWMLLFLLPMYIFVIWAALAVSVKRWHDRGKSGIWVLIGLVPCIGALWALVELGFLEGTPGPNDYGHGPDR